MPDTFDQVSGTFANELITTHKKTKNKKKQNKKTGRGDTAWCLLTAGTTGPICWMLLLPRCGGEGGVGVGG